MCIRDSCVCVFYKGRQDDITAVILVQVKNKHDAMSMALCVLHLESVVCGVCRLIMLCAVHCKGGLELEGVGMGTDIADAPSQLTYIPGSGVSTSMQRIFHNAAGPSTPRAFRRLYYCLMNDL